MIPGFLIAWATFPGVMLHEWSHKQACHWRGIRVRNVEWFNLDGSGLVTHDQPREYMDSVLISTAPIGSQFSGCDWVMDCDGGGPVGVNTGERASTI